MTDDTIRLDHIDRCPMCGRPGEVYSISGDEYGPSEYEVLHDGDPTYELIPNDPRGESGTVYMSRAKTTCTVRLQPLDR